MVEDNRDLAQTTMAILRAEGYDCTACYTGTEALACVQRYDPDVVLLDIRLPGKSGWELAVEIREHFPGRRPMLVGISGEYQKSADRLLAQMRGFDFYLAKPVDPKVLLTLLKKVRDPG